MAISKALILSILGCLCFCSSVLAARELNDDLSMVARHERWMVQYNRVYKDTTEKAHRFEVFKANVGFIESFNAENRKFYLGINQFTDLTNEEFKATKANKGYRPSLERVPTGFRYENVSLDALPETIDWRTKGAVVVGRFLLSLLQRVAKEGSWTMPLSS
uniref:Cathepsin propeptide inhibitor domain-containing protein n=1 Tax=Aegilops tauschii subsp. strangulata TaxID=200361 RepID=A0A453PU58_AEGTS